MERFAVALALVVVAVVVALLIERRRPDPPAQGRWPVPAQLDRADFERPDAPWLIVVFSSRTCDSCAAAQAKAEVLAAPDVAVQEVVVQDDPGLHRRYGIDAVPTTVLAGADGVVQAAFVGPPSATDLWAAVADARARSS